MSHKFGVSPWADAKRLVPEGCEVRSVGSSSERGCYIVQYVEADGLVSVADMRLSRAEGQVKVWLENHRPSQALGDIIPNEIVLALRSSGGAG